MWFRLEENDPSRTTEIARKLWELQSTRPPQLHLLIRRSLRRPEALLSGEPRRPAALCGRSRQRVGDGGGTVGERTGGRVAASTIQGASGCTALASLRRRRSPRLP